MHVTDSSMLRTLRILEAMPGITQREMARRLGVSLGKANYCVRALVGKGFIKVHNFRNSKNKQRFAYLLTPAGIAAKTRLTRQFIVAKRREYDALRREIEELERGSEAVSDSGENA